MENEIKVSVICLAYNAEKYIRRCLDSILHQITNFNYEIIIHDDASKDNTQSIIIEYQKKEPQKIRSILEDINQYSKGIDIINDIMVPIARGKYIAYCECDDFWCDDNKLQKQYDELIQNDECVACVHNTIKNDLNSGKQSLFNNKSERCYISAEEVIFKWTLHASSYFIRKDCMYKSSDFTKNYWFGDYMVLTTLLTKGDILYLPEVMSQYNYNNIEGVMKKIKSSDFNNQLQKITDRIDYLMEFNKYSKYKYDELIKKRIEFLRMDYNFIELDNKKLTRENFNKIKRFFKNNVFRLEYLNEKRESKKAFLKFRLKSTSYIINRLYRRLKYAKK